MPWPKGKPRSEETKQRISKGCRAALSDSSRRERMSAAQRGERNHFFGKTHSDEARKKITAALTGRYLSDEHRARVSASLLGNQRARGNRFTLTESQKAALAERQRGPNGSGWRGGVTPEHQRIRTSAEYREWRTAVFERDEYTCQRCQSRNGNGKAIYLHAHHIKPFARHPEERFLVENGMTVCLPCHRQIHKEYV